MGDNHDSYKCIFVILFVTLFIIILTSLVFSANCDSAALVSGCTIPANTVLILPSGNLYSLNASPSEDAIRFSGANAVLDCNGSTIMGNSTGYGIQQYNVDNSTLKNCIINNYDYLVYLHYKPHTGDTIMNNTFINGGTYGIINDGHSNVTISNNQFYNGTSSGYVAIRFIANSNHSIIKNNIIIDSITYGTKVAIQTFGTNVSIINNTISGFKYAIDSRDSTAHNVLIEDNIFYNMSVADIYTSGTQDANINRNRFINSPENIFSYGIYVGSNTYNINISNNIFGNQSRFENFTGVYTDNPSIITFIIKNNSFYNNLKGLDLRLNNSQIIDNKIYSSTSYGLYIYFGVNNLINDNYVSNCSIGIATSNNIYGLSNNYTLINNTVIGITDDSNNIGIYLRDVSNYTFYKNNITNNYNGLLKISSVASIVNTAGNISENYFYNNTYAIQSGTGLSSFSIYNNIFDSNGYSLEIYSTNATKTRDFMIFNNSHNQTKYVAIKLTGVNNITINNEIILDGSSIGILSYSTVSNLTISNSIIKNNRNDGIHLASLNACNITNNLIYNNSFVGLSIPSAINCVFNNNNISNNGKMGIAIDTRGDDYAYSNVIKNSYIIGNAEMGVFANAIHRMPIIINNSIKNNGVGINGFFNSSIYFNNSIINNDYDALITSSFNNSYYSIGDNITLQSLYNNDLLLVYPNKSTEVLSAISSGTVYNYTFTIPKNGVYFINNSYADINKNNYTSLKFIAGSFFANHSIIVYHRGGTVTASDVPNGDFALVNNAFVLSHGFFTGNGHDHGVGLFSLPKVREEIWCNCGAGYSIDSLLSEMKSPSNITSVYVVSNFSVTNSLAENYNFSLSFSFNSITLNSSYLAGTLIPMKNSTQQYNVTNIRFSIQAASIPTQFDWYRVAGGIGDVKSDGSALCGIDGAGNALSNMRESEMSDPNFPSYTIINFSSMAYYVNYSGNNPIYFYDSDNRLIENYSFSANTSLTIDQIYRVVITGASSLSRVNGLDNYTYSDNNITGYVNLLEDISIVLSTFSSSDESTSRSSSGTASFSARRSNSDINNTSQNNNLVENLSMMLEADDWKFDSTGILKIFVYDSYSNPILANLSFNISNSQNVVVQELEMENANLGEYIKKFRISKLNDEKEGSVDIYVYAQSGNISDTSMITITIRELGIFNKVFNTIKNYFIKIESGIFKVIKKLFFRI